MLVWELTSGNGGREPQPQTSAREYLDKSKRKPQTNAGEYLKSEGKPQTSAREYLDKSKRIAHTNTR